MAMEKNRLVSDKDIFYQPLCNTCTHYHRDATCEAFPDGILKDILTGEFDHRKVHPDQKGDIVFEPIAKK